MTRLLLASVVLLGLSGCDSASDFVYTRAPGWILENDPATPTIQVPSQIRPGVPVQVTVTTRSNLCTEVGDTEVALVGGVVEIRPYELRRVYDEPRYCTLEEKPNHSHVVAVTFPEAGPVIIRAVGEIRVGTESGTPQVYELGIVVR